MFLLMIKHMYTPPTCNQSLCTDPCIERLWDVSSGMEVLYHNAYLLTGKSLWIFPKCLRTLIWSMSQNSILAIMLSIHGITQLSNFCWSYECCLVSPAVHFSFLSFWLSWKDSLEKFQLTSLWLVFARFILGGERWGWISNLFSPC